jgi:hypothetical protein
LHDEFLSDAVLVAIRQHSQETSTFDGGIELALKNGTGSGQASGNDFAVFRDKVSQGIDVFVVNLFHTGHGETTKTLSFKEQGLGVALWALVFVELFKCGHGLGSYEI